MSTTNTFSRAVRGWLVGCAAAAAVISGVTWIILVIGSIYNGDPGQILGSTVMLLLMALVVFLIACLLSGFPTAAFVWLSEKYAIRSIWFFGCAGTATGLLSDVVLAGSFGRLGPSLFSALFAVAGLVAGIVYWRVAGRHAGRDVSEGMA